MARKEALKYIKNMWMSKETHDALETLIPELKESEDERIIKLIRSLLENARNVQSNTSLYKQYDDAIAWLEKQKEEEGMITVSKEAWDENAKDSFERGIKVGMIRQQKEQKSEEKHYWNPTEEDVKFFNKAVKTNMQLTPSERAKLDIICSKFKHCSGVLQEQKPVEKPDLVAELKHHLATTPKEQLEKEWKELEHWNNIGPTVQEFLYGKPVEWSEEDEKYLDDAYCWLCEYAGSLISKNHEKSSMLYEIANRLKSFRPPQDRCKDCPHRGDMFLLTQGIKSGKHELASEFMNYLDENRPEEKTSLSNAECKDIDEAFKECDWAKIMRYVEKYSPSWKPSEHQMTILKAVKDYVGKGSGYWGEGLGSLIDDLEKLM